MAEYRDSQQADQMKTQPTPQPGETYSTHIVPTDSYNASSSYRNDTLLIGDSARPREISTTPSFSEDDILRPNTCNTDTFEDKRQVLDACASDLAESIWNNVKLLGIRREQAEALSNVLPDLLRQMALRLGHGSESPEERDAQAFVHQNSG